MTKEEEKKNTEETKEPASTDTSQVGETPKAEVVAPIEKKEVLPNQREVRKTGFGGGKGGYRKGSNDDGGDGLEEKVVEIDRITRVVKGGRRMRFRATVVVGDKNGKVGVAVAKGTEVLTAITKATSKAKKELSPINLKGTTIPHEVYVEYSGAKVLLKPASPGTGIIAGGPVRAVVEAAGVKDVLSKAMGSNSRLNNVYATFLALKQLRKFEKKTKGDK
ncbi:30S ribosomal protein S5 [bacterium (Candidatus Howlettbacteria) CG_4_10_14_0_8_um_filter_40_9]|nr:MAG: 30S ribosomal protein S5 [bacterium (Candidatus Howlettbacteria) CG_4_10_14_0_8_um_filter_40_9]